MFRAVHHELWGVDVGLELAGVASLAPCVLRGRERVFPVAGVPVVDVLADRDDPDVLQGLGAQELGKVELGLRAARAALRGEQLDQHRSPGGLGYVAGQERDGSTEMQEDAAGNQTHGFSAKTLPNILPVCGISDRMAVPTT